MKPVEPPVKKGTHSLLAEALPLRLREDRDQHMEVVIEVVPKKPTDSDHLPRSRKLDRKEAMSVARKAGDGIKQSSPRLLRIRRPVYQRPDLRVALDLEKDGLIRRREGAQDQVFRVDPDFLRPFA